MSTSTGTGSELQGILVCMLLGPLTDMTTVVTSAATAVPPSHSVFGAIGADLTNHRLPLSKSGSVANMGTSTYNLFSKMVFLKYCDVPPPLAAPDLSVSGFQLFLLLQKMLNK